VILFYGIGVGILKSIVSRPFKKAKLINDRDWSKLQLRVLSLEGGERMRSVRGKVNIHFIKGWSRDLKQLDGRSAI
jgi:hypothetical protein